jgi:luciferase family oxidoreductase group 1
LFEINSKVQKGLSDTLLSVLDLSPIVAGSTPADALHRTLDLAQHADQWGFNRYWLAEHHNMAGIASAATSVVIGYVAGGTSRIRVGSGGIMLPNHAPLVIAEQFGTLESLYPGRIDLGLGRAPGTDQRTARAIHRQLRSDGEDFPEQVEELRSYLREHPKSTGPARVRAIPGEGLNIPIWLLGSSDYSAQLAGQLGLPFAFAGQFAPENTMLALAMYRHSFQPSEVLDKPYAMVGVNVIAADTDEFAEYLATTQQQKFLSLTRGLINTSQFAPPVENMDDLWSDNEKASIERQLRSSIVGGPKVIKDKLQELIDTTQADEIMINAEIYNHADRIHSYEIVADIWKG